MAGTKNKAASIAAKAKPHSPRKARSAPNMREKLKQKTGKPDPTIRVHGFEEPFALEAYEYTMTATKPGFVNQYRKWAKGDVDADALTEANFNGFKMQRDAADDGNESLKTSDGYARIWMIRYPPENESTERTRQDGLRILKDFFMSTNASLYPPSSIKVVDETTDVPSVLEDFFLDADIEEIVKASFDTKDLNDEFYVKYRALSETIYFKKEPSAFAHIQLGLPTLD
jgi:hypothetical protein